MTRWLALALVMSFLAGAACAAQDDGRVGRPAGAAGEPVTIPLTIVGDEPVLLALVPVTVDGAGPFAFALDTGAPRTSIDRDVADRLGLPTTGEREVVAGVTGQVTSGTVSVEQWAIGEVPLGPRVLTAVDVPEGFRSRGVQGVLGADVLSGFAVVGIDYRERVLRLSPG